MNAVIDRIENGIYILECDDGTMVNVHPEHTICGLAEGMVVCFENNQIVAIDPAATAARAARAAERLARLTKKE